MVDFYEVVAAVEDFKSYNEEVNKHQALCKACKESDDPCERIQAQVDVRHYARRFVQLALRAD